MFFNKVEVYSGFSLEELSKVRAILEKEGIKYTYKVKDLSGSKWFGPSRRGSLGTFGINRDYEKQYVVSVKKQDVENAQYFIHKALNS